MSSSGLTRRSYSKDSRVKHGNDNGCYGNDIAVRRRFMNLRKYLALTRLGMMEKLHYRLGTFVTLFGNLVYLVLIYFLWKAIYASSGTDVVNGMTLNDTLVYLVLATALFNFLEVFPCVGYEPRDSVRRNCT